jgi:AraC-like DNA-binding protein
MDVLSDVLTTVQLTGAIFFDLDACPPFASATPDGHLFRQHLMPAAEHIIAFHVVAAGSCWAEVPDSGASIKLHTGDLVVVPTGQAHVMSSAPGLRGEPNLDLYRRPEGGTLPVPFVFNQDAPGERTHLICGFFGCDRRPFNPLLEALPPIFHASVSSASQQWLLSLVRAGAAEYEHLTPGGETMLAKVAELMFVEVIRKYITSLPADARGWCSALRDPHVSAALKAIHQRPTEAWTVDALAREAGMSRSMFAERFTAFVGEPPMQYLARWRLQRAATLLTKQGIGVAQAAAESGYESEAAFSRAFKRFVGMSPGAWRRQRLSATGAPSDSGA